jgi:hypothetical protein
MELSRDAVLAFRLAAHHLDSRVPETALLDVATVCAVQNSPPGSALVALNARVAGVSADLLDELLVRRKTLDG